MSTYAVWTVNNEIICGIDGEPSFDAEGRLVFKGDDGKIVAMFAVWYAFRIQDE